MALILPDGAVIEVEAVDRDRLRRAITAAAGQVGGLGGVVQIRRQMQRPARAARPS